MTKINVVMPEQTNITFHSIYFNFRPVVFLKTFLVGYFQSVIYYGLVVLLTGVPVMLVCLYQQHLQTIKQLKVP